MTWDARSRRRAELPRDWHVITRDILDRDCHQCRIQGPDCTGTATEVDHIGSRHDHTRANLRAACHTCHGQRTSAQGNSARAATRALEQHPRQRHPGRV